MPTPRCTGHKIKKHYSYHLTLTLMQLNKEWFGRCVGDITNITNIIFSLEKYTNSLVVKNMEKNLNHTIDHVQHSQIPYIWTHGYNKQTACSGLNVISEKYTSVSEYVHICSLSQKMDRFHTLVLIRYCTYSIVHISPTTWGYSCGWASIIQFTASP